VEDARIRSPRAFLKFVAKAALNAVGGGVLGDFLVEVLPEVARDVWQRWGKDRPEEELRRELQRVAELPPAEAQLLARQVSEEEAACLPEPTRLALTSYLTQVPNAVRQSQRRPADPSGSSISSDFRITEPADLLPLLPARLPRFRPGDRLPGIGDWELEELLGVGGFGEVWKARNPHLAEPVALKFCLDQAAARALRNEAALLGRVMSQGRHSGIVELRHTYLSAEVPCLEYEYVAGGNLSKLIAQWRRSSSSSRAERATRLVHRLAEIVAFAHRLSPPIVHRDLKPANVLLRPTEAGKFALRITDFGIGGVVAGHALARQGQSTGKSLTKALRGAHTPLYASPQQVGGAPPDPRDDVYSLGVIWFQLLTTELGMLSLPADWRDLAQERGLSGALLDLLASCLASREDRRPCDAGVLAEQLEDLLNRQAAVAREEELQRDAEECDRLLRKAGACREYLERVAPLRLPLWRAAAERGKARGQWLLGLYQRCGSDTPEDKARAAAWYRRAAARGYAPAQASLGWTYAAGLGVEKDEAEAVRWFRKAAEQGHASGQVGLGFMYTEGRGVRKDEAEAVRWFRKAAEQGYAEAQYGLGWIYESSRAVGEALLWYRRAAEQGSVPARETLERLGSAGR
jgi:serine/threonine protein kinase